MLLKYSEMAYQQKEGQGSLFKNDKQNDRQPDFRGTILIKGVTYNISAWNRTSQNGREYISLQAEEKTQDSAQGGYQQRQSYQQKPAYQAPPFHSPDSPAPSYQAPSYPGPVAPAPTMEDLPPFADEDDLPF